MITCASLATHLIFHYQYELHPWILLISWDPSFSHYVEGKYFHKSPWKYGTEKKKAESQKLSHNLWQRLQSSDIVEKKGQWIPLAVLCSLHVGKKEDTKRLSFPYPSAVVCAIPQCFSPVSVLWAVIKETGTVRKVQVAGQRVRWRYNRIEPDGLPYPGGSLSAARPDPGVQVTLPTPSSSTLF